MESADSTSSPRKTGPERSGTLAEPPQGAATVKESRLFRITELLERILLFLPTTDADPDDPTTQLFVLQRVNSTFRAAILESQALRRKMDYRSSYKAQSVPGSVPFSPIETQTWKSSMKSRKALKRGLQCSFTYPAEPLGYTALLEADRLGDNAKLITREKLDLVGLASQLSYESWVSIKINADKDECIDLLYSPMLLGQKSRVLCGCWQTERSTTWHKVVIWVMAANKLAAMLLA